MTENASTYGARIDQSVRISPRPWDRVLERDPVQSDKDQGWRRAIPVVLVVSTLAILSFGLLLTRSGPTTVEALLALLLLAGLALAAEYLNYQHLSGASGSIALIPFSASVLLVPTAGAVIAVGACGLIVQLMYRRQWFKSSFNVSQMVLGTSLGALLYTGVGGVSLFEFRDAPLGVAARAMLLPASLTVATMIAVNATAVSAVVALTKDKQFLKLLRSSTVASAKLFLLTAFVTFYFAWLYVRVGAAGAAALALPLLAIRQLYRTTLDLTRVSEELLDLMVAAIEARDPYTSGHSRRVSRASRIIAESLGRTSTEVERITVAALLHDVGKIDEVFAPILAKEGRLTPQEWELMKRHPIRSAELVSLVSSLRDVVTPVRHHHENWDGTGYPDGLRGEDIPLASRIIMFADTLDAMTTDRPYRRALSLEDTRAEFARFKGTQFDPNICETVLSDNVWKRIYESFFQERQNRIARVS